MRKILLLAAVTGGMAVSAQNCEEVKKKTNILNMQ